MSGQYIIRCPYCFNEFDHTEVKFRSEFVNLRELDDIPGEAKEEAKLFSRRVSDKYKEWWTKPADDNNETPVFSPNEKDPTSGDIPTYERPVIDPSDPKWQKYLSPVDTGIEYRRKYLLYDSDGMAAQIKLCPTSLHGEITCTRRVCPHCHNPLPENFGKTKIITIPIIGVTNSGKTVYMSSLLKHIRQYVVNVGYNGALPTGGAISFREANKVEIGAILPQPTEAHIVQQPICFTMTRNLSGNRLETYTVVLYDLAGEYFTQESKYNIAEERKHRKSLIEKADGIILLIDPAQLTRNAEANLAVSALEKIQNILLSGGKQGMRAATPIAICVPKADDLQFLNVFGPETQALATHGVVYDANSKKIPATQYNELYDRILETMEMNADNGIIAQTRNYEMSRFFAFSAVSEGLIKDGKLTGEPTPQRIEEPLLWLFAKNGYCDVEGRLTNDLKCPNCGSYHTRYEEHTVSGERKWRNFFRKEPDITYDHICRECFCKIKVKNGG